MLQNVISPEYLSLVKGVMFVFGIIAGILFYVLGFNAGRREGYREAIWEAIDEGATVILGKDKGTKCPMCGQERK